jgi:hypothetical protein
MATSGSPFAAPVYQSEKQHQRKWWRPGGTRVEAPSAGASGAAGTSASAFAPRRMKQLQAAAAAQAAATAGPTATHAPAPAGSLSPLCAAGAPPQARARPAAEVATAGRPPAPVASPTAAAAAVGGAAAAPPTGTQGSLDTCAPIPVNTCGCGELRAPPVAGPFLRCGGWRPPAGSATPQDDPSHHAADGASSRAGGGSGRGRGMPTDTDGNEGEGQPEEAPQGWWTGSALLVCKEARPATSRALLAPGHGGRRDHHSQPPGVQPSKLPQGRASGAAQEGFGDQQEGPRAEEGGSSGGGAPGPPVLMWWVAGGAAAARGGSRRVEGQLLDEWGGWRAWRFNLEVPVADQEQVVAYRIEGPGSGGGDDCSNDDAGGGGTADAGRESRFLVAGMCRAGELGPPGGSRVLQAVASWSSLDAARPGT